MSREGMVAEAARNRHGDRLGAAVPGAVAVLVAAVLTALITLALDATPIWMADFLVYHAAGGAVVDGTSLYDLRVDTAAFSDMLFTYPPFAALLFTPLSLLGAGVSAVFWTFVNFLCLGAVLWLSFGRAGVSSRKRRTILMAGGMVLAIPLTPVLMTTMLGQVNLVLMLLVLVDFSPALPGRWRGIGIGIAAGLKLTPLIFVVYLLCTGRRSAALRAGAAFLGTVVLGFVFLPADSRSYWLGGLFLDSGRITDVSDPVNQSLPGLFARLSGTGSPPGWWLPAGLVVGALGLFAAVRARRQGQDMAGILVAACTALLISPISWPHHLVWIVPALVWLLFANWRKGGKSARAVLAVVTAWFVVPLYWLVAPSDRPSHGLAPGEQLILALTSYLTPIVLVLVLLPVWLRRLRPAGVNR